MALSIMTRFKLLVALLRHPAPVTILTAESLQDRGINTVAEALQRLTANGSGALNSGWNGAGGNFASGGPSGCDLASGGPSDGNFAPGPCRVVASAVKLFWMPSTVVC